MCVKTFILTHFFEKVTKKNQHFHKKRHNLLLKNNIVNTIFIGYCVLVSARISLC